MARPIITEAQIRRIAQEEATLYLLEEGLWDDVKAGATKLKALLAKKFGSVAGKWGQAIKDKIDKFSQLPDDVKQVVDVLKAGMKETGESIQLDDNLKAAKELGSMTTEKALALAQADLEGPVHSLAAQIQKSGTTSEARHYGKIYKVLIETPVDDREQLNEFGVVTAAGVSLAILGGLPMLFKGLEKLAHVMKADGLASLFHKAEHVCHSLEVKVINAVVPNKLSYFIYVQMHKRGLKFTDEKEELTFDEYVKDSDKTHAMKRVNGLIYKALLIYFAFNGLAGVLHAGASLLGLVEGAATTVKGVELARGAMEIAALASKTA